MTRSMAGRLLHNAVRDAAALAAPPVTWKALRKAADSIAAKAGEWGGAPMPVEHAQLIMEPRYPFKGLNGFKFKSPEDKPAADLPDIVNAWFDYRRNGMIYVYRENGKSKKFIDSHGSGHRLRYWIDTLGIAAAEVWDIDVESRAIEKLRSLVSAHAFRCYMLGGTFLETSKRSGVTYLFRKLRPTIAMRPDKNAMMDVIAVLCLHPLGYYSGTWAGVMCPTDDVVAHLMLMRGDEHWFWKKSNHHEMWTANAGI